MNFSYRVKLLGCTITQLMQQGFNVNLDDCKDGEFWVVGCSSHELERKVKRFGHKAITSYEAIR